MFSETVCFLKVSILEIISDDLLHFEINRATESYCAPTRIEILLHKIKLLV